VDGHRHVGADRPGDVERLARAVGGVEVGLVLGAGGARGLAHIGVLTALAEVEVPVDQIGGASVGALVAGAHAMGRSPEEVLEIARRIRAARPFTDWALPVTSILRGRRFEHAVREIFDGVAIEDLWVPVFCNSCDIARFRDVVHDRGGLADAALASSALPGVLPPRPEGGGLLVDGGTTNMLPVPVMRARSHGPVVAVDVSAERELHYPHGRFPTSWSALWQRLRPGGPRLLTAAEVFWRAAACDLAQRTAEVAEDVELFLRPPVERFGTTDLGAMEEIVRLGLEHARARLAGFSAPARGAGRP
jgi:predicted acylesterase/phospholipase RssA